MPRGQQARTPFDWGFVFLWIVATSMGWVLGRVLMPALSLVMTGVAMAILQWLVLQSRIVRHVHWLALSVAGWAAGGLFVLVAVPIELDVLTGPAFGAATGFAQWLVLRREVHWSGWWLVVMPLAWTTGLSVLPGILLTGVMAGLLTGIALALLLRNPQPQQAEAGA